MRRNLTAALAAAALLGASALLSEETSFEKTIPFPREREGDVGITFRKCTILRLTPRNYPDDEDVEKARANDPKDTSWLWWQFDVDNRGPENLKIKLFIDVLDKDGKVIKSSDRSVTIEGFESEEYRISMRIRTLDAAEAPKVRVRAQFLHDKKS
jgi:hypothetical protein